MSTAVAPDLTALPVTSWATTAQFVTNNPYASCPDPADYVSPWTNQYWLDLATSILFHLTGRRFPGVRTITATPAVVCGCNARLQPWVTSWDRMQTFLSDCGVPCSACGHYPVLDLGNDINTVTSVTIDGTALSNTLYRVDDHRWLVRLADPDGTNPGWTKTPLTPPSAVSCKGGRAAFSMLLRSRPPSPIKGNRESSSGASAAPSKGNPPTSC